MRRPPPPSSSGPTAALPAVVVEELLGREGELTRREEALAWEEYLDNIAEHTAHGRQVLNFDKMMGERRAMLDEWERDLELRTAALVEAQSRGINPQDNRDEVMEFVLASMAFS
jgi:hypothetical protein